MLSKEFNQKVADKCTEVQLEVYESYCNGNIVIQIAKSIGKSHQRISYILKAIEKKCVRSGVLPAYEQDTGAGAGRAVGKVTTHVKDGKVQQEWVRTDNSKQTILDYVDEVAQIIESSIKPRVGIVTPPQFGITDLMAVYPIADAHMGLYAWAQEAGEDFDCDLCSELLRGAADRLVAAMPQAALARIEGLGDFFHSDTEDAVTRRSGYHLDVDGRWGRVLQIGVDTIIYFILKALEKHEQVEVVMEKGNHDDETSYALSLILLHHFKDEPRVSVDMTYCDYHYKEFGKVLIGTNHGMVKPVALHGVMCADQSEAWGRTLFRYWHVGHMHHEWVKEVYGVIVEGFRSIKAKDASESRRGYRAGRAMTAILYHKEYGEIERHTCSKELLLAMFKGRSTKLKP